MLILNAFTSRQCVDRIVNSLPGEAIWRHKDMSQPTNQHNQVTNQQPQSSLLLTLATLKPKCRHFSEIFITGCTESRHFDHFRYSQWWKFRQNGSSFRFDVRPLELLFLHLMRRWWWSCHICRCPSGLVGPHPWNCRGPSTSLKGGQCTVSFHYDDVIMGTVASQITSFTIVYSTVYSGAHQSKHQSSASLAFLWGIHRGPVNSPHKLPVTRKMFPFDDVIMPNISWWLDHRLWWVFSHNGTAMGNLYVLIHARQNSWTNSGFVGDLRRLGARVTSL